MVKHPSAFMVQVAHPRLRKVIYHVESDVKHRDFISQLKKQGIASGVAIKPDTPLDAISHIAGHVDTLLFMTVDPGYYGSPFKQEVVEKIQETRSRFNDTVIAADGGVSLSNLHLFLDAGVDYACVGSRIFHGDNPGENYRQFLRRLEELDTGDSNKSFQLTKE
jgi:ribulose-phosphate 3-epimerase